MTSMAPFAPFVHLHDTDGHFFKGVCICACPVCVAGPAGDRRCICPACPSKKCGMKPDSKSVEGRREEKGIKKV